MVIVLKLFSKSKFFLFKFLFKNHTKNSKFETEPEPYFQAKIFDWTFFWTRSPPSESVHEVDGLGKIVVHLRPLTRKNRPNPSIKWTKIKYTSVRRPCGRVDGPRTVGRVRRCLLWICLPNF